LPIKCKFEAASFILTLGSQLIRWFI